MTRAAFGRLVLALTIGATAPSPVPVMAAVGTVKCCLEASIDDAPARGACITLNVRSRSRRPKAAARRICRLLGGRPLGRAAR
jgi:hypothetical protein